MIPKKDAVLFLLERADIVHVMVNARAEGVSLPPGIAEQFDYAVRLDVGLNMPKPIDAFVVDEAGMTMELSFNNMPHKTVVPWKSVYCAAVANEAQFLWFDDAPRRSTEEKPPEPEKPSRGGLRAV